MDAASNTGVDNIREIIESARYRPLVARYKVYLIDEVHMLSKGAFNALLKTLEERSEEHTSELQPLMRISYAAFCMQKNKPHHKTAHTLTIPPDITHNYT